MKLNDDEIVLFNGRIWTGNPDQPSASAAVIRNGRFVAVGSDDLAADFPHARKIDLQTRRVTPGLHDSHLHAVRAGVSWRLNLHWEDVRSLSEALGLIEERARNSSPGTWISVVGGWHARQFAEGRGPTRAELDQVAPNHPVYVQMLYDEAVLNTYALNECGWSAASEDPERGELGRDSSGALTGVVKGVGAFSVPLQLALQYDHNEAVAGTRAMMKDFARHGLTGIIDGGGLLIRPEDYRPLYDLWRSGDMPVRTRLFLSAWNRGAEVADIENFTRHIHPGFGDEMLKTIGVGEIVHLGSHDMEGLDEFEFQDEVYLEFLKITRHCVAARWPMQVHAVLDTTLGRVLDAWEKVYEEVPGFGGLRFSIVHGDEASERNIQRMARMGIGLLSQPRLLLKASDYVEAWGEQSARRTPPLGDYKRHGVIIGAGSDSTRANWYAPWANMWCLITGQAIDDAVPRDAEHRLTREEALQAYTYNGAWFTNEERTRGRIQPGYLADVCVPSRDPLTCQIDDFLEIRSDLTLLGGRVTHASGQFEQLG